eukprot:TRINITY_DN13_c0_g1_i3.p1 TRINITY_DN13_c0_g1~~TRINITY_DN13_c0_g1_i3.p1  ORF type:complete len:389 (-),score=65.24 TRINITY_DN13_c0_g1_i3:202-1368(-)
MASRPLVTVQNPNKKQGHATVQLPAVLLSPIRSDIVQFVHTQLNKNHRQPYAVSPLAGMQTAAESWGTGRAVSRIPRVPGGGTHRAGQGAFGNMCRGGRMFSPTKTYRRWHRKVNLNQRRFAVASALAASAVPALVQARGHRIDHIAEVPLVVADSIIHNLKKTKEAVALLKSLHAYDDVEKSITSRRIRPGKGKARNRRYLISRGPLIIHTKTKNNSRLIQAFRNLPGVELANVYSLNLLKLAPGGHLGRFIVWTESAFKQLNNIFGTPKIDSIIKKGYRPPTAILSNADISRIITSEEIQSVIRPKKIHVRKTLKKNPLKNFGVMKKLNPYALTVKRRSLIAAQKADKDAKKKKVKKVKKAKKFIQILHTPAIAPVRGPEELPPKF